MDNEYRRTATTVSMLNYHFVFCPRYRRKIFNIPGFEARFKQLTAEICKQHNIEILALECHIDHVHLFVNAAPCISPSKIMQIIKANTAKVLLSEYKEKIRTASLWTRSYFVSTAGNVCSDTIKKYIDTQKTRG